MCVRVCVDVYVGVGASSMCVSLFLLSSLLITVRASASTSACIDSSVTLALLGVDVDNEGFEQWMH